MPLLARMEPSRLLAIESLWTSMAQHRGLLNQLRHMAEYSPSPKAREWAKADMEKLEHRMRLMVEELAKLEAEESDSR